MRDMMVFFKVKEYDSQSQRLASSKETLDRSMAKPRIAHYFSESDNEKSRTANSDITVGAKDELDQEFETY